MRARKNKGNPEQLRMRQCLCVIAVCQCLYIFIMLCCPDFNNLQREERFFSSKLSNHVSSLFSGWMKYGYVSMAITIFGFCLHAVMRQAFPSPGITTISSLSWPCTPSWTFWTYNTPLNVLFTTPRAMRICDLKKKTFKMLLQHEHLYKIFDDPAF